MTSYFSVVYYFALESQRRVITQGRRKVLKSGGRGSSSNVMGIIWPTDWDKVNFQNLGGELILSPCPQVPIALVITHTYTIWVITRRGGSWSQWLEETPCHNSLMFSTQSFQYLVNHNIFQSLFHINFLHNLLLTHSRNRVKIRPLAVS